MAQLSLPSKPRRGLLLAFAALLLLGGAVYRTFAPGTISPPIIATGGLDPAVAKLIESTVRAVRAAPDSGEQWGRLGSVLMHYEFIQEARTAFNVAEKLSPNDARWPYLHALLVMPREPRAVAPMLRRAVAGCGNRPDMPRLQLAQWLAERGESMEAEEQFQALLRFTANHPRALLGLAQLRRAQGRLEESRSLLERCLNDPHTAKAAHVLLAQVEQAIGNGSVAEVAARRGANLPADTPWPDPFWNEAAAFRVGKKAALQDAATLMDQGQLAEALGLLGTVTRDYPDDDEAWYLTGWALNRAQRGAEAERALREHRRLAPQSPKGHAQLAVALLGQQRAAEAVAVLEAALKLKPTWRELHFNLGYACVQLGREDDAIRHLRDALALDPNHLATHTALAELLIRRGEIGEARRLLNLALEIEPADARTRGLLQSLTPSR